MAVKSDPTASFPAGLQGDDRQRLLDAGRAGQDRARQELCLWWVPVPADRKGKKVQATGGHNSGVPKGATKADKAWQFIEYLTTDKAIDIIFNGVGWLGASKSYLDKVDTSKYKGLDWYVKSIKEANDMRGMDVGPDRRLHRQPVDQDSRKADLRPTLKPEEVAKQMQDSADERAQGSRNLGIEIGN